MSSSPAGAKPDKAMSSRLLTMKFMQRAAAAKESQPQSAEESKTPTPKRQRLSSSHASPVIQQSSDMEAINAAIAAEESKRREATSRQAAESGESEWVLDYPGFGEQQAQPLVVAAGSLDANDDEDMLYGGRQSYGNFKRKKKSQSTHVSNEGEDEDEDGDEMEEFDLQDPARIDALINRAKFDSKNEKKRQQPEKTKLSQLTSLSGTRQATLGGSKPQKKRRQK